MFSTKAMCSCKKQSVKCLQSPVGSKTRTSHRLRAGPPAKARVAEHMGFIIITIMIIIIIIIIVVVVVVVVVIVEAQILIMIII